MAKLKQRETTEATVDNTVALTLGRTPVQIDAKNKAENAQNISQYILIIFQAASIEVEMRMIMSEVDSIGNKVAYKRRHYSAK